MTAPSPTYAWAWDRVLAEWDTGRLDLLHPPSHNHDDVVGAVQVQQEWGETKQYELIGISASRKDKSNQ